MSSPFLSIRKLGFAVAAVMSLSVAMHDAQAATEAQYQAALKHFEAADNNPAEIDKAYQAFDALRAAEPNDPVLLAYTGAAHTWKATAAAEPMDALTLVDDGVAQIEKSLALLTPANDAPGYDGEPGSMMVRFVAANTFLSLPSMFHKGPRGAKLLDDAINSPAFSKASPAFQGNVLMRAANKARDSKQTEQATLYAKAVISKKLPQAADAQALLSKLGS